MHVCMFYESTLLSVIEETHTMAVFTLQRHHNFVYERIVNKLLTCVGDFYFLRDLLTTRSVWYICVNNENTYGIVVQDRSGHTNNFVIISIVLLVCYVAGHLCVVYARFVRMRF